MIESVKSGLCELLPEDFLKLRLPFQAIIPFHFQSPFPNSSMELWLCFHLKTLSCKWDPR